MSPPIHRLTGRAAIASLLLAAAWPAVADPPATEPAAHAATTDPAEALSLLRDAMATLETLEQRALTLSAQSDDIVALLGVPSAQQARRTNDAANAVLAAALSASQSLTHALRAIPPATPIAPHPDELSDAIARSEDALAMLIPLRIARATLVKASLIDDEATRAELTRHAHDALLPLQSSVPWAAMERSILLALADASLGQGQAAMEQLLDARAALSADPRLSDPALRLTLQLTSTSVLAALAEAGPDAAHAVLERIATRPPFAVDTSAPAADPFARLLLADLNARIELQRLASAGGMASASPHFRQRVLEAIAQAYARTLDEPALREHRESLRVLAYRRLATIIPESISISELPILAALSRVAAYEQQLQTADDPQTASQLARTVVDLLRAIAARDDTPARSIRADVLYDLAAAEQRINEHASAAKRLLEFVRIRPDDDRASRAIPRAMTLAEQASDRALALEAGWFAHRAPFDLPERDAIRLRLIALLVDGNAYRDAEDPSRFDLRGFFTALLVEADQIAGTINNAGPHGLALRETLVSGDAWALALAERYPDELKALELTPVAIASQAERRATDLLTYTPAASHRKLSPIDRTRALTHRARAWLALDRPLDALTDADLALQALHDHQQTTGSLDPLVHEDVLALMIRAAAEARQHERARVALERALDRNASAQSTDRLLAIIAALHRSTQSLVKRLDRPFIADPSPDRSPAAREQRLWLPERTAFLIEAATQLDPASTDWHDALRYLHAHACLLAGDHAAAITTLTQLHATSPPSIPAMILLGEAHLLNHDDAGAFAQFRSVIATLDASPDPPPALWQAWARTIEILERQAASDETGRRTASAQRQIRRLRLRPAYHQCEPCAAKIEAAASRLKVDAPAAE